MLSPAIEGRQYVIVLNDGNEDGHAQGRSAQRIPRCLLIDAVPSSPTY